MSSSSKKDPGVIRFMDDMDLCTESLGFESCNERQIDDDDGRGGEYNGFCEEEIRGRWRDKKRVEEKRLEDKRNKKFPPPLSSLNQNGKPCFYLKPVRANGRLELTEVKIHRPEILCAVRENGRLRLHLVSSDACCKFNEEEEDEEREHEGQVHDLHEEEEKAGGIKVEELWTIRVEGGGPSRFHEMVDYHRHHGINGHHSMHVWRQPSVSIR
ncbi:protein FANTASTIC FOUR 2-like [Hibiscus syriacus]|uniref:protein FANTASTIC FOUR 2-like n=1 Tax=Hibiscus syriacus TaxID=106335 RepID=UPI0019243699|nr:protein FANTASTIC FOUR 2-like [Hibiscus syriacus]